MSQLPCNKTKDYNIRKTMISLIVLKSNLGNSEICLACEIYVVCSV